MTASTGLEKNILLEVCVDTPAGLQAAIEGGADRIELCSSLAVGGLTPSQGFMALAAEERVPAYPLLRPREGDFCYSDREIDGLRFDIDAARNTGLKGVVIGANLEDGRLDEKALRLLCKQAEGLDMTLHRAFDLVPDPMAALETAIDLGFTRILTSGGAPTALEGLTTLVGLMERAGDRITIMPGSGVRPENLGTFREALALHEIHASCSTALAPPEGKVKELGFAPFPLKTTDAAIVQEMKKALAG